MYFDTCVVETATKPHDRGSKRFCHLLGRIGLKVAATNKESSSFRGLTFEGNILPLDSERPSFSHFHPFSTTHDKYIPFFPMKIGSSSLNQLNASFFPWDFPYWGLSTIWRFPWRRPFSKRAGEGLFRRMGVGHISQHLFFGVRRFSLHTIYLLVN